MAIGKQSLACIVLPIFVSFGMCFFVNPEPIEHSNHIHSTNNEPVTRSLKHDTNKEPKPPTLIHGANEHIEYSNHIYSTNSEPVTPSLIHGTNSEPVTPSLVHSMQLTKRNTNTWCITKPTTDDQRLDANIQFCCTQPGVDCDLIQPGGRCYNPDHKCSHASVVMNLYYQANHQQPSTCYFMGSGLIVYQNPCNYIL
ncbi:major pollen allergen Ole e 10-like [Pyrus ussuriensis x Pyrus communis]|uniref:Major pollen allergen Ole e 10-like n=1 Tax=Pyrus ussuriensis x Pyrus communis TaxID=2448454 RepID=A0A5N5HAP9_9ROSA|nr:major pollen allergen Ole e 10-like [Pyrus ussuriensis x Pyrus communis]